MEKTNSRDGNGDGESDNNNNDDDVNNVNNDNSKLTLQSPSTTSTTSSPNNKNNNDAFSKLMQNSSSSCRIGNISSSTKKLKRKRPESNHNDSSNSNNHSKMSTKTKKNLSSRFVPCPVGCGKHVLSHNINTHVDLCLLAMQQQQLQQPNQDTTTTTTTNMESSSPSPDTQQNQNHSVDTTTTSNNFSKNSMSNNNKNNNNHASSSNETTISTEQRNKPEKPLDNETNNDESCPDSFIAETTTTTTTINSNLNTDNDTSNDDNGNTNNIFLHMMKKSAQVFAQRPAEPPPKLFQRMHLHDNGQVTVTCYHNKENDHVHDLFLPQEQPSSLGRIAWSSTILVRKTTADMQLPVELTVSTSIPPAQDRIRLVRHHSRLSVPVLKSILQKSVRRRKPLPSVRVAMELWDKSQVELLRRLPIIVLEDTTLHPDMPLLVWLMMASSKGYIIPPLLTKRLFGIVYEIASCPWRDPLNSPKMSSTSTKTTTTVNEDDDSKPSQSQQQTLSITSFHSSSSSQEGKPSVRLGDSDTLLWAILMRSNYGGMPGDMKMLRRYATLWNDRFFHHHQNSTIPETTQRRLCFPWNCQETSQTTTTTTTMQSKKLNSTKTSCCWSQVPTLVHQAAANQSQNRIDSILPTLTTREDDKPPNNNNKNTGLLRLSFSDITTEGVDFHCSSVLTTAVLDHPSRVQDCLDCLQKLHHHRTLDMPHSSTTTITSVTDGLVWLEDILKSCMWKFSAGVNLRLPLVDVVVEDDHDTTDDPHLVDKEHDDHNMILKKQFWEEHVLPHTKAFSERYVQERLSKL
ncbi:hypothetical protein IV203_002218 [Nitzschia inconspicua]|uniref:UBZ4-type domain-containing protein n=1 Tax=Nitzschia inconspicua TaxID=303405 RepID=A0A9K3L858_9STRA|nr:hypothetical protein IV203_002218 [Nitzschia inconspicua]